MSTEPTPTTNLVRLKQLLAEYESLVPVIESELTDIELGAVLSAAQAALTTIKTTLDAAHGILITRTDGADGPVFYTRRGVEDEIVSAVMDGGESPAWIELQCLLGNAYDAIPRTFRDVKRVVFIFPDRPEPKTN